MQTNYAINIAQAVPGVLADLSLKQIETLLNTGAGAIGFGLAMVRNGSDLRSCMVPTATGQQFVGLSVKTDEYAQLNSGAAGYKVNSRVNTLRKGKLYVQASGAVAAEGLVYFNVVTGQLGPIAAPALSAAYTKNAGATGNYTASAVTAALPAVVGTYVGSFTDATHYDVVDPNGNFVGSGTTGVAFALGGLGFTITAGGTPAVEGDGFHIAVTSAATTTDLVPRAIWRTSTAGSGIAVVELDLI